MAVSPAPPLATLELVADLMPRSRLARRAVLLQLAHGESAGFVDGDGRLIAAIGFYPLAAERAGESLFELWFVNRPEAAGALPALRRLARLTLRRIGQTAGVRIRANVAEGHETGRRLARLMGLAFAGAASGLERWEWPRK